MKIPVYLIAVIILLILMVIPAHADLQNEDIRIENFAFQPQSITIEAGTTVIWTNSDPVDHTVTSTEGIFDSGLFGKGEEFEYTFNEPGTYPYFCIPHPQMTGEVIVLEMQDVIEPAVLVADQEIINQMVRIDQVISAGPGWIVIHAEENGTPGPVIGYAPVEDGVSEDLMVTIDLRDATETLFAMLHIDAGVIGVYEFPGEDVPVFVDGEMVVEPFAIIAPQVTMERVGLELIPGNFVAPVTLTSPDDGTNRLFVVDQVGLIWIIDAENNLLNEPFLDISANLVDLRSGFDERGLLGLAFHRNFADNNRFFIYYSAPLSEDAPQGWDHTSRISEFAVSQADPNRADHDSERVILEIHQPQFNHNGGSIMFGPDGYLYIPLGDGGGSNDVGVGHPPQGHGQDITTLLGSILRIDIDGEEPYEIPDDNPFVEQEGRDEIFAYGIRNAWRTSFDAGGERQLFAADAGQALWESVNIIEPGGNYGWNLKEGSHAFDPENPGVSPEEVPVTGLRGEPLIDPIIEYPNANQPGGLGAVVVGGYIYRGSSMPELYGRYIFAEWNRVDASGDGILFVATPPQDGHATGMWEFSELEIVPDGTVGAYILALGQDANHELYVLTSENRGPEGETGRVYRITPPLAVPEPTPATPGPVEIPGFGAFLAVAGLCAAASLALRRR
ncbi:glucose/arabinose dehydrogenase/plastocyanin [Methanocalculus alkaliphilus]|uniref:PQQ-dependent sugar dehydrogenase n=1 Tax=Methanocalculus alkaliphilus TaxID=768730 RepID=UPI0020A00919|nr:PQQ-dependent sugar dehydrogenase [Methanocalculus alkaliphilus]MCP1716220.1 glucose/arabinose dehydrogenase/plastocyanin [Methanocalculus alkaliphilus]